MVGAACFETGRGGVLVDRQFVAQERGAKLVGRDAAAHLLDGGDRGSKMSQSLLAPSELALDLADQVVSGVDDQRRGAVLDRRKRGARPPPGAPVVARLVCRASRKQLGPGRL